MTTEELDARAAEIAAEAPPIPPESWAVVLAVMGGVKPKQKTRRTRSASKAA